MKKNGVEKEIATQAEVTVMSVWECKEIKSNEWLDLMWEV